MSGISWHGKVVVYFRLFSTSPSQSSQLSMALLIATQNLHLCQILSLHLEPPYSETQDILAQVWYPAMGSTSCTPYSLA